MQYKSIQPMYVTKTLEPTDRNICRVSLNTVAGKLLAAIF